MSILLTVLFVSVHGITQDEACHFVGARIAQASSECIRNVCTNVVLIDDVRVESYRPESPRLSCSRAVTMMESHFREVRAGRNRSKRARVNVTEALISNINEFLVPPLEVLILGGTPRLDELTTNLTKLHDWALQTAGSDSGTWMGEVVPSFVASEEYAVVTQLFANLIKAMSKCSLLAAQRRSAIAGLIHFLFRFVGLIG